MPEWTRNWTELESINSMVYFDTPRDFVLLQEPRALAECRDNWGAFKLVGLVQLDHAQIHKACGQVSLELNDLQFFFTAGKRLVRERYLKWPRQTGPPMQWVYCIPGTGKGDTSKSVNLTLVAINDTFKEKRVEVYFMRGLEYGEHEDHQRSQLPGMKEFYFRTKLKKIFGDWWNMLSTCCGS